MEFKINKLAEFDKWFKKIKDYQFKLALGRRLKRIEQGNFGDYKMLDDGLIELRFFARSGHRVYCIKVKNTVVVLLIGGNKTTQQRDIEKSKALIKKYTKE